MLKYTEVQPIGFAGQLNNQLIIAHHETYSGYIIDREGTYLEGFD